MNLSPSLGTGGVSRLTVLLEDGERVLCRGWRDDGDGDGTAVLAVLPASEHPPPAFVDQLAHEYGLKDELDGQSAARPLALVREHGRTMLLLEDPGGGPLARLLGLPMEMGRFLRFATGLSAALRHVHEHGLIHKDIKPANVLVDFATGQVWLTGFGIAARLPRERQSPEPPEFVAGTLAYMAPEQTGRMNRSIDSRSDLYSLGVTLYEMLTGALPFMASDPMEWVHCHIARQPVPPVERLKDVPVPVSAIVSKLLAKTAEERYQTAAGLERDLRHCLAAWETQHRIDAFPLGQQDTPDRLLIPEKLYGREREIGTLLAALPAEDDHLIQAEAKAAGNQIEVVLCQKSITSVTCPESIVRYVVRTRESVILDDASRPNIFSEDDYLRGRPAKSILCLPLIKQGRLTALLYLENTPSSYAFAPDRIAILELLAAQAAISLENTRLYSDLQEREAKVRRLVESNIIGISIFDFDGRVIEANEAFLHIVGRSRNDIVSGRVSWSELTPAE
jgi:serine/threonine protein kinase